MPNTNRETVRKLCQSILNRLENRRAIEFAADMRERVRDELFDQIGQFILTEEDLKQRALEKIGGAQEDLENAEITESAQFRTAKSLARKTLGDDELNGMFFQKSLKEISTLVIGYLMGSSHIDEVFESDDNLQKMIVEIVKRFKPENLH